MRAYPLHDDGGRECGSLSLVTMSDVEALARVTLHEGALASRASLDEALAWALARVDDEGSCRVEARVYARERGLEARLVETRAQRLRASLGAAGFRAAGDRREFALALDAPALTAWIDARAARDPFVWSALAPAGELSLERASRALRSCSEGDPESSPDEDPHAFLRACLDDESFVRDPAGLCVGALERLDGAFVMTQVQRDARRARITYMARAPALRGRGLGTVVHARGLALARAQGATSYHGGTSAENRAMLALFRALGADETRAVERWVRAR